MTVAPASSDLVPREEDLVFNIVWTGKVFPVLRYFVLSQMTHTTARFRFVANWCAADQIALMEDFRRAHPQQVVEVLDVSPDVMESHGEALERTMAIRDDGDWFCFIDPDIKANGPWVGSFLPLLADHDVVTSGTEIWTRDNLVPEGSVGVAGEHFFSRDGFTFGSPHLAIYRKTALDRTRQRWGVRLGSAGPDLSEEATARIHQMGHKFVVWDTAKLVNVLMQADGSRVLHRDIPELIHIGGLSHYISPTHHVTDAEGRQAPEWTRWEGEHVWTRHLVTRFTADTLMARIAGVGPPEFPEGLTTEMQQVLLRVRDEATDLIDRFRSQLLSDQEIGPCT